MHDLQHREYDTNASAYDERVSQHMTGERSEATFDEQVAHMTRCNAVARNRCHDGLGGQMDLMAAAHDAIARSRDKLARSTVFRV